ncbi:MAG: hypothetical protein JOZ81_34205 [Chloroflexi bacterium]|nr:hypothetical protein [Chloroflexota bacterium]MBV9544802.1 hypothetical protein [Chloroflexota bacterium]
MAITTTLPIWIALLAIGMLVAVVVWANQRELAFQASEARASQAETRAATAEAAVAVQAELQAATATALAYASSPEAAVDRSLKLVLAADREPSDQRLRALSDAFAPAALGVMRPEVEHLLSGGLHLGGDSTYDLQVLGTDYPGATEAQVHTHERWLYDERNASDQRTRCLIETSDQTYTLERMGAEWQVADVDLASSSRSDCPGA